LPVAAYTALASAGAVAAVPGSPIPPEWIRLLHGGVGAEWDVSPRVVIRTDAALWFGGGLDWIMAPRVGVGYRF
jgi:hypothetical protein